MLGLFSQNSYCVILMPNVMDLSLWEMLDKGRALMNDTSALTKGLR